MAQPAAGQPAHLKHYFVSSDQQFDAAKMGMWLFLITEILLFSGMFVAYTVYRVWHPEVFAQSAQLLDWRLGGLNTLVLLASSFTVAHGIQNIQKGNRRGLIINLALTLLFALIFMGVKYVEYSGKFEVGIFPGASFAPAGQYHGHDLSYFDIPFAPQFFSIYFVMTGIHGVHVPGRNGHLHLAVGPQCQRALQPRILHPGRTFRPVLASGGHHLDLPLPPCFI